MSKYLNKPVAYLEDSDFNSSGDLVNPLIPKDKAVVIMIQANFCGYCTVAKPDFQKFADITKDKVFAATIQGDGKEPGEKALSNKIKLIQPDFRGYPDYVVYLNGKRVDKKIEGRGVDDLINFSSL
jgi:thiol-disulfide isomerase/thioredoxin